MLDRLAELGITIRAGGENIIISRNPGELVWGLSSAKRIVQA